ncbi:DUF6790 family protein [Ancylobacter defluvii]|uniref:Uncharacterized protein n=1 Tax=Ancylobacter defluvii TaxID=1282440 RepID=A0A9W6JWA5_9HYPH|nr:DUF6790 family protein [Ancylobacter defluvii]GLK84991.1 hypothetical protein GCM10017653_30610 [Ancylobacter defluvii]
MIYYATLLLTMVILPVVSIASELAGNGTLVGFFTIASKWFVFWAVGVRLLLAGIMQLVKPGFTASSILGVDDLRSHVLVQELGCANLAMGAAGLLSLLISSWVFPVAFIGGAFLGLAGLNHMRRPERNFRENMAMASDLVAAFILFAAFIIAQF